MESERTQTVKEATVLVNIVEEFVRIKVRDALRQTEMCRCGTCELNVCAIALNNLTPRYVTSSRGHLLAQIALMSPDFRMDATIQISKALKMVKEKPRH